MFWHTGKGCLTGLVASVVFVFVLLGTVIVFRGSMVAFGVASLLFAPVLWLSFGMDRRGPNRRRREASKPPPVRWGLVLTLGLPIPGFIVLMAWTWLVMVAWLEPYTNRGDVMASEAGGGLTVEEALDKKVEAIGAREVQCSPGEWYIRCEMVGPKGSVAFVWDAHSSVPVNRAARDLYPTGTFEPDALERALKRYCLNAHLYGDREICAGRESR